MLWTWNAADTCGFSSTLILTSSTAPFVASTTSSMMGPSVRHGPHHGAHRSTTTGTCEERSSTADWKVASVTSMLIADQASDDPTPSLPAPAAPQPLR
jgi:hypothetical protein